MRFRFVGDLGVADRLLMSGIREKGNTEAAEAAEISVYYTNKRAKISK